jgi:hypothetical protein
MAITAARANPVSIAAAAYVVIEFPRDLSKESVDDLADYLDTFMKRARREARPKDEQGPENEAAN